MTETPLLPEDRRREIFRVLVDTQDGGTPVAQSRAVVAEQFDVTEHLVKQVEREGLDCGWPPLDI